MPAVADPVALDLEVVVDQDADPVDWDGAVARFLLAYVRRQATRSAGTAAAEPVETNISAAPERL